MIYVIISFFIQTVCNREIVQFLEKNSIFGDLFSEEKICRKNGIVHYCILLVLEILSIADFCNRVDIGQAMDIV